MKTRETIGLDSMEELIKDFITRINPSRRYKRKEKRKMHEARMPFCLPVNCVESVNFVADNLPSSGFIGWLSGER